MATFDKALEDLYPAFRSEIRTLREQGSSDADILKGISAATKRLKGFGFSAEDVNNVITASAFKPQKPGLFSRFAKSAGQEASFGLFQSGLPKAETGLETGADVTGQLLGFLVPLLLTRGIGSPLLARAGIEKIASPVVRAGIRGLTEGALFTGLTETGSAIGRGKAPTAKEFGTNLAINMALFGGFEALPPVFGGRGKLPATQTEAAIAADLAKILPDEGLLNKVFEGGESPFPGRLASTRTAEFAPERPFRGPEFDVTPKGAVGEEVTRIVPKTTSQRLAEAGKLRPATARGPEFDVTPRGGEFPPERPFPGPEFDVTPKGGEFPVEGLPAPIAKIAGQLPRTPLNKVLLSKQNILELPLFPERIKSRISLSEIAELNINPAKLNDMAREIEAKIPGFGGEAIADAMETARVKVATERAKRIPGINTKIRTAIKKKAKRLKAAKNPKSTDIVTSLEQRDLIPILSEQAEANGLKLVPTGKGQLRIQGKVHGRNIDAPVHNPEQALREIFGYNADPYRPVSFNEILTERELSNGILSYERSLKFTKTKGPIRGRKNICR